MKSIKKQFNLSICLNSAGIGRVTEYVLSTTFDCIDSLELNKQFCETYRKKFQNEKFFGQVFNNSLHEFEFTGKEKYHCMWFQYVLEHLTDTDLIAFLKKCKKNLARKSSKNDDSQTGYLIIKENTILKHKKSFLADKKDSSMIRHKRVLDEIFEKCGFEIVQSFQQPHFPEEFHPTYIWILS
ncbi:hypothetical protein RFI_17878 [Reticulomyxa filosa]|uniref:Alpha N-terminal protein methyltransferase 1 n=1 Tax=Reticulomyxa filosa TaxID=46433 RepID=X6N228_RETFI|nr:hypothetical protein RFI_17878 [Reticulomyxa filosa]|eukprot:ETO19352.1 hypothetical protein RFI_17878 [Reticulomyxa filosa]